ncbi:hypothetical protein J2Y60_004933 [Arcicella sp. BE140]|nr:hypothetical protein [Arcicella sp. BE51]MDR6814715.1 hypothetical protein [Arcicella sp. BE140]MDR6826161.1 hypothetical protein [Arcicella sp. BE139]
MYNVWLFSPNKDDQKGVQKANEIQGISTGTE